MSALLEEVDQEIEARRKANELSNQVVAKIKEKANGSCNLTVFIQEWRLI